MAVLVEVVRTANVRYWSRYQLADGTIVEEELTAQEYGDLALPGAGPPPRKRVPRSAVWLQAAGGQVVWATPTGLLELGNYEVVRSDRVLVGLEELDPVGIEVGRVGLLTLDTTLAVSTARQYRVQNGTIVRL
jgi:hypothetical protein